MAEVEEIVDPISVHTNWAVRRGRTAVGVANGVVFAALGIINCGLPMIRRCGDTVLAHGYHCP